MPSPMSIEDYLDSLPKDQNTAIQCIREEINKNLPEGFEECIQYSMISYVVPHSMYPKGYHCDPKQPLPFMSLAARKSGISFYHMGIYSSPNLCEWFKGEYDNRVKTKLDMGKSCIRFKNLKTIPNELIGQLVSKMSVDEWVSLYESSIH